ncbi:MAG: hypothetical protein U0136_04595 [Bdellovibrionota bacterium]
MSSNTQPSRSPLRSASGDEPALHASVDAHSTPKGWWQLCSVAFVVFWLLRVAYWDTTYELPFSDMQDYETIARHILSSWSFQMDGFWQTYKAPVLPLLRAAELFFFGESFRTWQIFQAVLTCAGLFWLATEIRLACRRTWPAAALLIVVALSRPSIFWSLKLSSEGVAEALLYLSSAAALCAWRRNTLLSFLCCGMIFSTAMLNRPNFMLSVALFPAAVVVRRSFSNTTLAGGRSIFGLLTAYALGIVLLWAPWLIRSYRLYGHVIPFVTAGPTSFIYGVWEVPAENEQGEIKNITWERMLAEAPGRFHNDYEFYVYAQKAIGHWFRVYGSQYPSTVLRWMKEGLVDRNVQLTKVSRLDLLPGEADRILFDKSPLPIISGIVGLALLTFTVAPALGLIALLSVPAWLFACCLQGNPRFLEPMIPIFLYGNVGWIALAPRALRRKKPLMKGRGEAVETAAALIVLGVGAYVASSAITTPPEPPQTVALKNAGFESWPDSDVVPPGWTVSGAARVLRDSSSPHDGAIAAELIVDGEHVALYQDFDDVRALQGKQVGLSVWVKANTPDTAYLAAVDGEKWYYSPRNVKSGEWEKLEISDTPLSDDPHGFRIHLYLEHGAALFDQVSFRINR